MTFIICEVGSNWLNIDDCLDSIVAAKECGADAVKFQMYTHKELYGYDGTMQGELPRGWVPILHATCQKVGIEFMCSAFSSAGYRFIDPYVKRHKIASAENTDQDILNAVKGFGKPILISTGGCGLEGISNALDILTSQIHGKKQKKNLDITLMYCVSSYPAKNIDLRWLLKAEDYFPNVNIGYSCHAPDWMTTVNASAFMNEKTAVIEKHFKIRDMDTPDNAHSIMPEEFKQMVDEIWTPYYGFELKTHPDEADFIKYSKRRWIAELSGYYRTKKP